MSIRRCFRFSIGLVAAALAAPGCGEPSPVGTVKMDNAVRPGTQKPPEGQADTPKPTKSGGGRSIKDRPQQ